MATYFVASGGSNTSPYDTWAKAATSLQTALTAASTDGDIVVIQYNGVPSADVDFAVDTTYTIAANIKIISASADDAGTAYTPTVMGANYIGHGSSNRSITMSGAGKAWYVYGVTFRLAGVSSDYLVLTQGDASSGTYDQCFFNSTNSNGTGYLRTSGGVDINTFCHLKNCEIAFGSAGHYIAIAGRVRLENCTLSGSAITTIFSDVPANDINGSDVIVSGCDFSAAASGASICNNITRIPLTVKLYGCKLPTAYVGLTAGAANNSGGEVYLHDCAVGDTHGVFGYHNPLGALLTDTGITYTGGAAGQSWKIVTTSDCSLAAPFVSPWIGLYHTGTSAITPRLEILRDGSATAYTDQQVWGEFSAKTTSGTTLATTYSDGTPAAASGTAQATGAGLGSWSGESGTAWSGKVDSGAAITPAEAGHIRGRVVVSAASATVYVDPVIRTA